MDQTAYYRTPVGTAKIVGSVNGISSITVIDEDHPDSEYIPEELRSCVIQLKEYFNRERKPDFHIRRKRGEIRQKICPSG